MGKIGQFILGFGNKLIDALCLLSLVGVFLFAIAASSEVHSFGGGLLVFIIALVLGLVYVTLMFYIIYLFMDIRNSIKEIEISLKREEV